MQVFKLFFKVFRSNIGVVCMYIGIFMGILFGVIIPNNVRNEKVSYTEKKCDFAVFDNDNSDLSKALIKYLEETHKLETIADYQKETIQDELYARNVDAVIVIDDGFGEAFVKGDKEHISVYAIPDTLTAVLFEQHLNSYLSVVNTYIKAGYTQNEAGQKASEAVKSSVEVGFATENGEEKAGPLYYFFVYVAWIFVAMCVIGISGTLLSIDKKVVRDRIESSSYKFSRMNIELVGAVMVTGFAICSIFVLGAFVMCTDDMLQPKSILYIINVFTMMAVALSITFLVSKLTNKPQVISMMANVISLGMAFLCGVFVPLELLSDTVVKIAHFFPVYWYVKALIVAETYEPDMLGTFASYIGIQLLFAVAIICVGMLVARKKRVAA